MTVWWITAGCGITIATLTRHHTRQSTTTGHSTEKDRSAPAASPAVGNAIG